VAAALAGGEAEDARLAGLEALSAEALASAYNSALRKREPPFVLPLDSMTPAQGERRLFAAAYKGVTDVVTKYVWPWPALAATRWAARRAVSPNTVTAVSLVFVLLALVLFGIGQFALGLIAAWIMTFLDTVDGKLARVTLTSSKWGNVFDHGIDLVHPPLWWLAWWYGLAAGALPQWLLDATMWVVVIGYLIGRGIEGFFLWRFKMEIHAWRRIDSLFRLVTARRNPNLVLLTAFVIGGRADLGFVAVALWTIASLAFHGVRVAQAIRRSRAERGLRSWLSEPARAPA
jgi:phosphatidylglycerophosphate synthase